MAAEAIASPHTGRDKQRVFELMVVTLVVLVAVGVMLSFVGSLVLRSRDLALKSTARLLYMAVLDHTAGDGRTDVPITENSVFLRDYVAGSMKGTLRVTFNDAGQVERLFYTEGGKTVVMPEEQILPAQTTR